MALIFIKLRTSDVFIYWSLSFTKWPLKPKIFFREVCESYKRKDLWGWVGEDQNKGGLSPIKWNQYEGSKESNMKNGWQYIFYQFHLPNVPRATKLTVVWKNLQNNYFHPHKFICCLPGHTNMPWLLPPDLHLIFSYN